MNKIISALLLIVVFSGITISQQASTYFPSSTGYKWYYKNTPLDSLNNPQSAAATYQVDSFATVQNYQGLLASFVLSKSGLLSVNQNTPYTDTNYYNFQSTNAWYYLNLLSFIDSIPFLDTTSFIGFLRSFEDWYSVYRFAQTVNTNYTILSRDTTITLDTLVLPLRVSATGRRLNDQNITTVNGTFTAKKFLITFALSYVLELPPPLPPLVIPIVTRPDTTYIVQDIWVVRDVMPSSNVDLSSFGIPISFSIPGNVKELTNGPVGIINSSNIIPENHELSQNYPNPFNPSTHLEFGISLASRSGNLEFVSLKVYDLLGKEVVTLVNSTLPAGRYEVNFDASNLPGGIYYYKLESGDFSDVKKMVLIK